MLKIKWTYGITNDKSFKGRKKKDYFKILKSICHSCVGHTFRHNEFVVNVLEGAISGKKAIGNLDYST